jgi:hypothetical protein
VNNYLFWVSLINSTLYFSKKESESNDIPTYAIDVEFARLYIGEKRHLELKNDSFAIARGSYWYLLHSAGVAEAG